MELPLAQLPPGDPRLVEAIVGQLKSKGIFDKLRKECLADVDTKPAFLNLRQRVDGQVKKFLDNKTWKSDLNKNHLRDGVRKNIQDSGILDAGIDAIISQVVHPKIKTLILPYVEETVYGFLEIEKPTRELRDYDIHPKSIVGHPPPSNYYMGSRIYPPYEAPVLPSPKIEDQETERPQAAPERIQAPSNPDNDLSMRGKLASQHQSNLSEVVPMETDAISSGDDDILDRSSPNLKLQPVKIEEDNAVDSFDAARGNPLDIVKAVEKMTVKDETEEESALTKESGSKKAFSATLDNPSLDSISSNSSGLSFSPLSGKKESTTHTSEPNSPGSGSQSLGPLRSSPSTPLVDEKSSTTPNTQVPSSPRYPHPERRSSQAVSPVDYYEDSFTPVEGLKDSTAFKQEKSEGEITSSATSSPEVAMDSTSAGKDNERLLKQELPKDEKKHTLQSSKSRSQEHNRSKKHDDHSSHRDKDKYHHRDKDDDKDRDKHSCRSHHLQSQHLSSGGSGAGKSSDSKDRKERHSDHHKSHSHSSHKKHSSRSESRRDNKHDDIQTKRESSKGDKHSSSSRSHSHHDTSKEKKFLKEDDTFLMHLSNMDKFAKLPKPMTNKVAKELGNASDTLETNVTDIVKKESFDKFTSEDERKLRDGLGSEKKLKEPSKGKENKTKYINEKKHFETKVPQKKRILSPNTQKDKKNVKPSRVESIKMKREQLPSTDSAASTDSDEYYMKTGVEEEDIVLQRVTIPLFSFARGEEKSSINKRSKNVDDDELFRMSSNEFDFEGFTIESARQPRRTRVPRAVAVSKNAVDSDSDMDISVVKFCNMSRTDNDFEGFGRNSVSYPDPRLKSFLSKYINSPCRQFEDYFEVDSDRDIGAESTVFAAPKLHNVKFQADPLRKKSIGSRPKVLKNPVNNAKGNRSVRFSLNDGSTNGESNGYYFPKKVIISNMKEMVGAVMVAANKRKVEEPLAPLVAISKKRRILNAVMSEMKENNAKRNTHEKDGTSSRKEFDGKLQRRVATYGPLSHVSGSSTDDLKSKKHGKG